MIEVVRRRLDPRERYRWSAALAEKPILAERAPRARGPQLVAVNSAFLYLALLAMMAANASWGGLDARLLGALSLGGIALAARGALWMWRESRSRWPSGRFLFDWGYVEVEHDRLRYVAASELTYEIASESVWLHAGAWSTSLPSPSTEHAVAGLAGLGRPRSPSALDGYRDPPWVMRGSRVRPPRLGPRARDAVWVLGLALVGGALGHAFPSAERPRHSQHGETYNQIAPTARMPSRVPTE